MAPSEKQSETRRLSRANRDREFLYKQLAEILRDKIQSGVFKPGDRMPSMDTLSAKYAVNKVTVRRALAELSRDGLIYSVPAQGTYIAERQPAQAARKQILTVGLLSYVMVPGNTGFYHMEIIEGIREELDKVHANFVMLPVKYIQPPTKIFDLLSQSNLDAIVLLGHCDPTPLRTIINSGTPIVLLDHQLRGAQVDTILVDNRGGGFQAIEHLLGLGHRNIAIVCGPRDQLVTKERLDGALEAAEQANLSESDIRIVESDFQREGGFQAVSELLKSDPVPTAVFFMNDEMAAGGLQALHTFSSLEVPKDISLIGFDDTSLAMAIQPPLTTVQVAKTLMGRMAVQRLLAHIRQRDYTPNTIVVPTQLIVRGSTAPLSTQAMGAGAVAK
ncbi:MAG: GntR family transcriptional regulator [Kiritimatiellae bacterium]|nr:GntR family transcriptional regulator [Kiritimatiellia bacterium]